MHRKTALVLVLVATLVASVMASAGYAGPKENPYRPKVRWIGGERMIGDGVLTPADRDRMNQTGGRGATLAQGAQQEDCGVKGLPRSQRNVRQLSALRLTRLCGGVADVAAQGGFAYVHAHDDVCVARGRGGTWIVNVRDVRNPRLVAFAPSPRGSNPGEGGSGDGHVRKINTRFFNGRILLQNNETCTAEGTGGFNLVDVTNPNRPRRLSTGGDPNFFGFEFGFLNDTHQAFLWQQGRRAYVITTDNFEAGFTDVDIFNVTNPRRPRLIAETGMFNIDGTVNWGRALRPLAYGQEVFNHQPIVTKIDGVWTAILSYWDVGWVKLNLNNPSRPRFIDDSDYQRCDPAFPRRRDLCPPEGNAHSADWNHTREFILGADEDIAPFRTPITIASGANAGEEFAGGEFGWTKQLASLPGGRLNGPTRFIGYACTLDETDPDHPDPVPPPPATGPGEEAIAVASRGPVADPNHPHDACFFSEKVEAAQRAGYDAVIIANHHVGSLAGALPESFICGSQGHEFGPITVVGMCAGHRFLHVVFGTEPNYQVPYPPEGSPQNTEPELGQDGANITAEAVFDGWGYLHLLDADTLEEIDILAPRFVKAEPFATGFGTMSVHDPTADRHRNLAYNAWYSAGLRVARFGRNGIRETGHWVAPGVTFWGAVMGYDVSRRGKGLPGGTRVILVSDRDFGLRIFRYTGPGAANVP